MYALSRFLGHCLDNCDFSNGLDSDAISPGPNRRARHVSDAFQCREYG
jgi:hypothetical protein